MKKYLALFLALFACHGAPSHSVGSTVIQPATTAGGLTLGGDVTGTGAATVVSAISGSTPILVTPATFEFASATVAPTIGQAGESTSTQGANLTLAPQNSTHATDQGGGNLVVSLEAPTGAGTEARFEIDRAGGTIVAALGGYPGAGAADSCLWMLPGTAPTANNWTLVTSTSLTQVNGPSGGSLTFDTGGTAQVSLTASNFAIGQPIGGLSSTPLALSATASAIACGTGGTQTITAAQAITPGLTVTTGTLSSPCILDFSTNASTGFYVVDASGVGAINTNNLEFKNGTQTQSLGALPAGGAVLVWTHGTNHIVVN